MKKLINYLLIIGVIFIALLLIPIGIFLGIDLNNYKQEITQAVQSATGRQLQLKGELSKSVFPWLGVEVGSTSLGNAAGFQPEDFASVERVQVKIELLPLLQGKLSVDNIVLHGLVVNLAKNKTGVTNWDDLSGAGSQKAEAGTPEVRETPPDTEPPDTEKAALPTDVIGMLTISGVDIRSAQLRWDDQQSGALYQVSNLNLKTGAIKLDQPISLALSFDASANQPKVDTHIDWQGNIKLNLNAQQYRISNMQLAMTAEGDVLPVKQLTTTMSGNIDADLAAQRVTVEQLVMEALGLKINAQLNATEIMKQPGVTGHIDITHFNPRDIMKRLAIELPPMADAKALTKVAARLDVKGNLDAATINNLTLTVDESELTGNVTVKNFTKPAIHYELALNQINLDRYLPPVSETSATSSVPAVVPAPAANDAPPAEIALPVELIRSLDINGNVKVGKATVMQLPADNIVIGTQAKNGRVTVKPVSATLAEGAINTAVELDVTGNVPAYQVNANLDKVHFGPIVQVLMKDELVKGVATIKADIATHGTRVDDLQKQLNGTASFDITGGEVKYLDLADLLVAKYAKYLRQAAPADKPAEVTAFKTLTGSATITNGIVNNKDLLLVSSRFEVKGDGTVSLPGQSLDYRLGVKIINPTERMKKIGLDKLSGDVITATLKGPFNAIEQDVDYTSMIKKAMKQQVQQKIEQKREEKKAEVKQQVEEKKTEVKQEVQQEVQDKKEELREKARDKLKSLFNR